MASLILKAHLSHHPADKRFWELNGTDRFYIGPVINHYRYIKVYITKGRSVRICDIVTYIPNVGPIPETKLEDYLRQAMNDIVQILTKPPSSAHLPPIPRSKPATQYKKLY